MLLVLLGACAVRTPADYLAAGCDAGDEPSCVALDRLGAAPAAPLEPAAPTTRAGPNVYPSVGVAVGSGGSSAVGVGVTVGSGGWWDDPWRRRRW